MTTPAIFMDGKLQMGMQIRGGPWKTIPLATRDVNPALVFANEHQLARAASYQRLADKIVDDEEWNQTRHVFVTSPNNKDGKTSTAFNLAWALSTRAKPILFVELNFHKPQLRGMLGNPRIRYGIDSVLRGIASGKESVFSLVNDDLHVCAMRDPLKKSELKRFLPAFDLFLAWAKREYQWIVFDCPPVLSSSWNAWFDKNGNSVLLVARSERTPAVNVQRASVRLGKRLKGVVLNGASPVSPMAPPATDNATTPTEAAQIPASNTPQVAPPISAQVQVEEPVTVG
jgi:Mrp family chromosome partitioning ATPase